MYIFVKNYLGILIIYETVKVESVCSLLGRIAYTEGVNPDNIYLIWKDQILEQGKYLSEYGMKDNELITLIPKIKSGGII